MPEKNGLVLNRGYFFDRVEIKRIWINVLLVGPHDRPIKWLDAFEICKISQFNKDAKI